MTIIGCTGESAFQSDIIDMIESNFNANPLKLCQNNETNLEYWLAQCNGVVLAGGVDIHPRTYGGAVLCDKGFSKFDYLRDVREVRIIRYCLAHNIPMLGICRGHQILGVYFGFAFCPHLDGEVCHNPNKHDIDVTEDEPMHSVCLTNAADGSYEVKDGIYELFDRDVKRKLWVNSFHHQALINAPDPCRAAEHSPDKVIVMGITQEPAGIACPNCDKKHHSIIEMMCGVRALDSLDGDKWLSVQWHPEFDWRRNAASKMVLHKFKQMVDMK